MAKSTIQKMAEIDISAQLQQKSPEKQQPPPTPHANFTCPNCNSQSAWLDVYGGGPHCHACNPPPSQTLVQSTIGTADAPNDELDKSRSTGDPGAQQDGQDEGQREVQHKPERPHKWICYSYFNKITKMWHDVVQRDDFRWVR